MSRPEPESAVNPAEAAVCSVGSRDCGLVDAVMGGWFQNETDELF
ncbi:MAG TPA: SAM-dependent methyltransferase, partial [Pseudomonas sp.]|nr:SAM-dependent methyltransferase [Pseudomonas sp.]